MHFRSFVTFLAAASSFGAALAHVEELIVERTHVPSSCEVKTKNGDMLSMHYVRLYFKSWLL